MKKGIVFLIGLLLLCALFGSATGEEAKMTVYLGSYPQSNTEPEPIEWLVLAENDDQMLLLSREVLVSLPWHNTHTAVTWDNCDLRAWLNGEFLESAFSGEEQAAILSVTLDNSDDYGYDTPVGTSTQDQVFLLSVSEVQAYLPEDLRTVAPTSYALSHGAYTNGEGQCAWWLRSPGMTPTSPAYLASAGTIGSRAYEVDETIIGVRPALWVSRRAFSGNAPDGTIRQYTDQNGDITYIPDGFTVSDKEDEQTIRSGLVVIGPDGNEYVWIPTLVTPLAVRDFGSYFSGGGSLSGYWDDTEDSFYQEMLASVEKYGGFYMGRYETSQGANGLPVSKKVSDSEPGRIWVQFSPQDTVIACRDLYADNDTVQGFFPWGINWDTTLQWLIDSGCKTEAEVARDSTGWGNYSNDTFSDGARGGYSGVWEETKANNIYDLAGNNWEWTQERYGSGDYVMRGGGYNLMGGACRGSDYPAALRDPLPGNDHHPNVTFRIALYLK